MADNENTVVDTSDLEPAVAAWLERKERLWTPEPYVVRTAKEISESLNAFLAIELPGASITQVRRLGGGGSKEQFEFHLARPDGRSTHHVLRLDPAQSSVETDRRREFEMLRLLDGVIPAPEAQWIDGDGEFFGQPAMITSFEEGVVKPTSVPSNVSGIGIMLGDSLRKSLSADFLDYLATIHETSWLDAELQNFQVPDKDPAQAARWQVNWWRQVWQYDRVEPNPGATAAISWMLENLPACQPNDLVIVHDDYRTGNYLFDEESGRITAILDWELTHIGDFHEDVSWVLIKPLNTVENGKTYVSGLFERNEWIERYEERTGRNVNRRTLHFYEVLNNLKNVVVTLATCLRSARDAHTHQDVHQTWVAGIGHQILWEVCDLIERGEGQ